MTCKHVVTTAVVRQALEYGNFGNVTTDISHQDNSGSFDLRGVKCEKCGHLISIGYQQHPEDTKYVTIVEDVDDG